LLTHLCNVFAWTWFSEGFRIVFLTVVISLIAAVLFPVPDKEEGGRAMSVNILVTILIMAVITYLIRVLPLILIRREIKNPTIRSFLYYVPYVTLSVMTFPAILYSTSTVWSAVGALVVASLLALKGCKLPIVAGAACITAFLIELIPF